MCLCKFGKMIELLSKVSLLVERSRCDYGKVLECMRCTSAPAHSLLIAILISWISGDDFRASFQENISGKSSTDESYNPERCDVGT
jgi:hypothetical protein